MLVRNMLTLNPLVVTADDPISVVARHMRDRNVGVLPVVTNQTERWLIGVITDRDIVVRCVAAGESMSCRVGDHMTRAPIATAHAAMDVYLAIEVMKRARVRRLPVVDVDDTIVGILTVVDIARHLGDTDPHAVERLIEEIAQPLAIPA